MPPTSAARQEGARTDVSEPTRSPSSRRFRQVAERIALAGAIVILAGCGQDPTGPTTASGVTAVDRSADLKATTGITIRVFAFDGASVGVPVTFSVTGGRKPEAFTLPTGGVGSDPSSINLAPLAPATYTLTAEVPAGFDFFESTCGASDGSTVFVASIDLVVWELAKKGSGFCDITIGSLP